MRPLGHNGAHDKPAPRVGKKRAPRAASRAPVVREARELEALLQVSRTLSAGNDPADRAVLDLVRNVFGWDYAALWEVDPASRVASLLGASGDPALFPIERDLKRSIVPGSGLHGMAWQKSGPVVHSLASPLIGCERSAWALGQGLQSGVCCAAVVRGGPVHLLEVFRRGESDSGASDVALTENVAHLLASQRAQSQALRVADELRAEQAASRAALEHEQSRLEQHNQRIGSMLRVTEAAVGGDLRVDAQFDGTDALSDVGRALSQLLNKLRESFSEFGTHAQALGRSSNELTDASRQLSADSKETSTQASVVSTAAGQVSANVQTVAAGVEEMTASIKEIANSANDAARVAIEGVRVAERTNDTVAKLGDSSAEIGKVIKVITSIAQQTNLLALNATIEAGKGFAVVANEVKELAKETAKATEDISQKIEAIQEDTRRAVDAIARISEIIRQINDIQSTIAAAVEQQTATTNEISRNISEAAHGSSEIAQSVTHVAKSAARTTQVAGDCELAASRLGRLSADFHDLTTRFRY